MRYEVYIKYWHEDKWTYWGDYNSHEDAKRIAKDIMDRLCGVESTKVCVVMEEYYEEYGKIQVL